VGALPLSVVRLKRALHSLGSPWHGSRQPPGAGSSAKLQDYGMGLLGVKRGPFGARSQPCPGGCRVIPFGDVPGRFPPDFP
jgi:hypothetical protein